MQLLALQGGSRGGEEVRQTGEAALPAQFCSPVCILQAAA